ncbi:MAG: MarR family transcriptional regulator [Gammaproteobacteria bacterium]
MARINRDVRPVREPVPLPEPGSDVGFALRQLMQTFRQSVESIIRARGLDISFAHGVVLKVLAREPGLSGAQLARRTTVTAQSMNGLLRSMESTGIIVREKHPENRRTDCWYMTRMGLKQVEQAGDIVDQVIVTMLASISKSDAARLTELLQECAVALQSGAASKPVRGAKAGAAKSSPRAGC